MDPYEYSPGDSRFNLSLKQQTSRWSRYTVDFPSALQTHREGRSTAQGEYFRPRGVDRAPLLILLHGVGDASLVPLRWFARSLAGKGIACFVPHQTVHSSRMAGAGWRRMPNLSDDEWFESYRASVIEVRHTLDWAGHREEIEEGRVAVLGVSFGGFISSIAMAVDERITAAVLIVSGGNSAKIVQKARAGVVRKGYQVSRAEYEAAQQEYAGYLAAVAERGLNDVSPLRRSYLTDPMTFASYLKERPMLMINARWDEFIPREATVDFWEACGRPDITWLPGNHTGIWLWYPLIRRRISRFLGSVFGR